MKIRYAVVRLGKHIARQLADALDNNAALSASGACALSKNAAAARAQHRAARRVAERGRGMGMSRDDI